MRSCNFTRKTAARAIFRSRGTELRKWIQRLVFTSPGWFGTVKTGLPGPRERARSSPIPSLPAENRSVKIRFRVNIEFVTFTRARALLNPPFSLPLLCLILAPCATRSNFAGKRVEKYNKTIKSWFARANFSGYIYIYFSRSMLLIESLKRARLKSPRRDLCMTILREMRYNCCNST